MPAIGRTGRPFGASIKPDKGLAPACCRNGMSESRPKRSRPVRAVHAAITEIKQTPGTGRNHAARNAIVARINRGRGRVDRRCRGIIDWRSHARPLALHESLQLLLEHRVASKSAHQTARLRHLRRDRRFFREPVIHGASPAHHRWVDPWRPNTTHGRGPAHYPRCVKKTHRLIPIQTIRPANPGRRQPDHRRRGRSCCPAKTRSSPPRVHS